MDMNLITKVLALLAFLAVPSNAFASSSCLTLRLTTGNKHSSDLSMAKDIEEMSRRNFMSSAASGIAALVVSPVLVAAEGETTLGSNLYTILRVREATLQEARLINSGKFKDVQRAKQMAMWCMAFTVALACIISALMLFLRIAIVQLFSSDPQVLQGCEEIWPKLCYFIWILYIFGIQSAILRALGMQWELAKIIFICLWCGALPVIWYYSVRENGGIDAV